MQTDTNQTETNTPSRKFYYVKPIALNELCERVGAPVVAEWLGQSTSHIYAVSAANKVRKVTELACERLLDEQKRLNGEGRWAKSKTKDNLMILKVKAEHVNTVMNLLKVLGAQIIQIKEI